MQAQRALDRDLPVAEGGVGKDLRLWRFLEIEEGATDALDVLRREFAVLLAEILAQRLEPLAGVDELQLALAVRGLFVGQHPDVGGDAGVVEKVERQCDDGLEPVVLDEPAADVAFALPRIASEQRAAVVHLGDATAECGLGIHLRGHVGEKEHLPVARAGDERQLLALVHHLEARVAHAVLATHRFEVLLPALAVRRIGKHEVEFLGRERVVRERGPFRATDDVVGALPFAFQQHVRLADGVGLGVDLLAVEQALDLLAALRADCRECLLRHSEHAARAAGAVVQQVGAGLEQALDWQEHEVRHQAHLVARRPVLAGFLVVVLVKLADQLLEDRAHRVVVDAGRREVDAGVEELVDQRANGIGLGQRLQLIAELEVLEDVLHVRREAVEIVFEVGEELLLAASRFEIAERELRGVVEGLASCIAQRRALGRDARLVEHLFDVEHILFSGLEHRVHAPDDAHRQDHIRVLAALEEIAQHVIGDAPDKRDDFVVCCLVHRIFKKSSRGSRRLREGYGHNVGPKRRVDLHEKC